MKMAKNWSSSNLTSLIMTKQLLNSTHREKMASVMDAENEAVFASLQSEESKLRTAMMKKMAKKKSSL